MSSVLVLGAGLSCPPLIHYLDKKGYSVTLASRTLTRAQELVEGAKRARAMKLDIENEGDLVILEEEIMKSDAVISMLPYLFHPTAARLAIKHRKHFLTTSYVSDAMRELDAEAKTKGIILINECGVDPGMDHMSAMRVINQIRRKGGKLVSFRSFCGGIPAPSSNNNLMGYKFSWAPRGVLLAARNTATFLENGKTITLPSEELFKNYQTVNVPNSGDYEAYPNRNSLPYISIYGVEGISTMLRGTFRYPGWCCTIQAMVDLDLLSLDECQLGGRKYSEMIAERIGTSETKDLASQVAAKLKLAPDSPIIAKMEFLGLFSNELIPVGVKTRLDAVATAMNKYMKYAPGEKDMIVMKHEFVAEYSSTIENLSSTLILEGVPNGPTSMSTTVAIPVGIATHLILSGQFTTPGIQIPIIPELYNPILDELEEMGIKFLDKLDSSSEK